MITYSFTYSDPSAAPGIESERTPVLADGGSHGYSISPSSLTEPAIDCSFVGIDRVELSEEELAEGTEAQEASPGAVVDVGSVEPVWEAEVAGRLRGARVADGHFFAHIVTPEGHTMARGDVSTGDIHWAAEVDQPIEAFAPDGRGGVVLGLGTELRHVGDGGEQGWSLSPLRGDGTPADVAQIDVAGAAVLVGGEAYGLAEVDLDDGTRRWYLDQDVASDFAAAGDIVRLLDGDLALVAGGSGDNQRLVVLDRSGPGAPSVVWSREGLETGVVSDDGELLVSVTEDALIALDMATGDEVWQAETEGAIGPAAIAPPRIIRDEVVVVQGSGGAGGWDLETGEQTWRTDDREALLDWGASTDGQVSGARDPLDGQAVGLLDGLRVGVIDADGTLRAGQFHEGAIGTISALEVDGTLALITASSSSPSRPSNVWLVDLSDLG